MARHSFGSIGELLGSTLALAVLAGCDTYTFQDVFPAAFEADDVASTPEGDFVVSGSMVPPGAASYFIQDHWLARTDAAGLLLWERHFGAVTERDVEARVASAADGTLWIVGPRLGLSHIVRHLDADGLELASAELDLPTGAETTRIAARSGGGAAIFVHAEETPPETALDMVLVDESGNEETRLSVPGEFRGGRLTSDGGAVLAGNEVLHVDASGSELWRATIAVPNASLPSGYDVLETPEGGYLVGGKARLTGTVYALFALGTDSSGHVSWSTLYPPQVSEFDGFISYPVSIERAAGDGAVLSGSEAVNQTFDGEFFTTYWRAVSVRIDPSGAEIERRAFNPCPVLSGNSARSARALSASDNRIVVAGSCGHESNPYGNPTSFPFLVKFGAP